MPDDRGDPAAALRRVVDAGLEADLAQHKEVVVAVALERGLAEKVDVRGAVARPAEEREVLGADAALGAP